MNWQYFIIAILFLLALYYIWKKIILPFTGKSSGCDKGCGCSGDTSIGDEK